jgi:hypothetical protein
MQVVMHVNDAEGYGRIVVAGVVVPAEYDAAVRRVLAHPRFQPGMPLVFDLRAADLTQLSAEAFRSFAVTNQDVAARRGRARSAIVVADDLQFGLLRMYEVLGATQNLENRVFRELAAAIAWARDGAAGA